MKRRIRRSTKQYIIVALICIIVIGSAAIITSIIMTSQIRDEYQKLLRDAHREMEENKKEVLITTCDIKVGEILTEDKVEKKRVYASQPGEIYLTENELGQMSRIDIPEGTQLIHSMVTQDNISSELRELEYNVIHMNSNMVNSDTVDIRISYPNGESYVVLSKKTIKGFSPETATCFLWLSEDELIRMSAAIVDAGLYPGSKIYVSKYIEPLIQEESIVTYTPSLSILSLLEHNPNIIDRYSQELNKDVRKALENRLAASMAIDVTAIDWSIYTNNHFIYDKQYINNMPNNEKIINEPLEVPQNRQSNYHNSREYLFYADEEEAKRGDIEYGQ